MIIQIALIGLILLGVGIIILSKNVVHAAYALALVLVSLAGIYVTLELELLAVVQILLYAGGVIILLVFGVMMTNRSESSKLLSGNQNGLIAILVSGSVFSLLIFVINKMNFNGQSLETSENQIQEVGKSFLTEHLVSFELVAFILLVALVGASMLAKLSADG